MLIFYAIAMILSAFCTGVAVRARVDYAVLIFGLGTMFFLTLMICQHYEDYISNLKSELRKLFGE